MRRSRFFPFNNLTSFYTFHFFLFPICSGLEEKVGSVSRSGLFVRLIHLRQEAEKPQATSSGCLVAREELTFLGGGGGRGGGEDTVRFAPS